MSAISIFIITVISLLFSAFFSGMEIAFISSSKIKIELDNKKGEFSAKILSFSMESLHGLLLQCLLGITLHWLFIPYILPS